MLSSSAHLLHYCQQLEENLHVAREETEANLVLAIVEDNLAGRSRAQDVYDYACAVQTLKNIAHQIVALGSAAQGADHCCLRNQAKSVSRPFRHSHDPSETREVLHDFVCELKYEAWDVVNQYELACRQGPPDLHAIRRCSCMAGVIVRCAMRVQCMVDPKWSPAKDMKRQGYGCC